MLFSATMPAAIVALARTHMRHPMNIRAESSYDTQLVPATAQFIYQAHDLDKPEIIGRILQAEDADKIIVFTRTKRQSQRVADDLIERGFSASPLHGDMAQVAREKALTKFRDDKLRVLVATDVAARGIDVAGRLARHQLHLPRGREDLRPPDRPHRPRRAPPGIAVTFVDWADLHRWKMINKALDLPFEEPQETYSTSEHLFHDLGIPPGTKGRIVDPAPVERAPRSDRNDRSDRSRSGRGDSSGDRSGSGDRPARNRDRSRTRRRGGETVAEGGAPPRPLRGPRRALRRPRPTAPTEAGSGEAGSGTRNRNRRRRRPSAESS